METDQDNLEEIVKRTQGDELRQVRRKLMEIQSATDLLQAQMATVLKALGSPPWFGTR